MLLLNDPAQMTAADPSGMFDFLYRLPEVAEAAYARGRAVALPNSKPRQVLIGGMGGSAISGDLARNLLFDRCYVPIAVSRHSQLPAYLTSEDLVILLSYSGNTAETLGCLEDALARRIPVVLVTSGGRFGELAAEHQLPVVSVESGWQPRAALGELYFSLLGLLSQLPGAEGLDPAEVVRQLRQERETYLPEVPTEKNPAKQLAAALSGKMPLIFGIHPSTEAVATRWKCQINENSKMTALANVFPELTHNEIVNLGAKAHPGHVMVILRDPEDPELLARQLDIARDILRPQVDAVFELTGAGASKLTRQMSLVYLGDYVSVYLATMAGIDPTPVEAISHLKQKMAGKA